MGHVVRCLALADELSKVHGCEIAFALWEGKAGIDLIEQKHFGFYCSDENDTAFNYSLWLFHVIDEFQPSVFIMDIRDDLPVSTVKEIKHREILVVTIDDPSERRLIADLAFYPPVPQVKRMDWTGFAGKLYVGWEWVLIRPEFSVKKKKIPHDKPVILITMGGSDPRGMTLTAIQALELVDDTFEVNIVIGSAFTHNDALNSTLKTARHRYNILTNIENMADVMHKSDIAIASFGVTAYELASMGVPSVLLCLSDDHAESASAFVEAGMMISLGNYKSISIEQITSSIKKFFHDQNACDMMSKSSLKRVDGLGTKRIAETILSK
jgi:spore coat polysaccharide biosynthesis protein SpsF